MADNANDPAKYRLGSNEDGDEDDLDNKRKSFASVLAFYKSKIDKNYGNTSNLKTMSALNDFNDDAAGGGVDDDNFPSKPNANIIDGQCSTTTSKSTSSRCLSLLSSSLTLSSQIASTTAASSSSSTSSSVFDQSDDQSLKSNISKSSSSSFQNVTLKKPNCVFSSNTENKTKIANSNINVNKTKKQKFNNRRIYEKKIPQNEQQQQQKQQHQKLEQTKNDQMNNNQKMAFGSSQKISSNSFHSLDPTTTTSTIAAQQHQHSPLQQPQQTKPLVDPLIDADSVLFPEIETGTIGQFCFDCRQLLDTYIDQGLLAWKLDDDDGGGGSSVSSSSKILIDDNENLIVRIPYVKKLVDYWNSFPDVPYVRSLCINLGFTVLFFEVSKLLTRFLLKTDNYDNSKNNKNNGASDNNNEDFID